jgi:hypothetical protein
VLALHEPDSGQKGRTPDAVGQTWFDVGVEASSIFASLVIVRPGILASARTFLALIVTATEPTKLNLPMTRSRSP